MRSLKEIVEGCKRQNPKFQKMLFESYAGKMKYVCLRYLTNHADAEDVLQEAFINVFSNIGQYREQGPFEAWMRRIFVNCSLMAIRKKKSQKENILDDTMDETLFQVDAEEIEEGIESSDIDPDKVNLDIIRKADLTEDELHSCISILQEDFRIVFNLYFIDNYSHAEIGSLLNIDENTSRTRLSRARKKVREELYRRSIKKVAV